MKLIKKSIVAFVSLGFIFSLGASTASASWYIPLEIGMDPIHYTRQASSIKLSKKLGWYDSASSQYLVTYIDGNGEYIWKSKVYTSTGSFSTPESTYVRPISRTSITFRDHFSVVGKNESKAMSGSITLTR